MLRIENLIVGYGDVTAVDGVDLDIEDGTVTALLGPSGCGKSTLLRAVAGLEPVRGGRVCWNDVDLASIPVHRRGFGLMFQDGVLFPHRTVAGNIGYGLRFSDGTRAAARVRVGELLDLVGLSGYGPRRVSTLSGGEAQRVALARALAPRPRLLLLDEPLAALDRALRDRLLTDLRAVLVETGTTALFVTHDQNEAFAIAERIAVMRSGSLCQVGAPRGVWSRPADEWVARFIGYTSVVPGLPRRTTDGAGVVSTPFGDVPGDGELVALRPSALVLDPAGSIRVRCVGISPAPEEQRLTVVFGGSGGSIGPIQAVAGPGERVEVGQEIRLRLDPAGAAVIATGARVRPAVSPEVAVG